MKALIDDLSEITLKAETVHEYLEVNDDAEVYNKFGEFLKGAHDAFVGIIKDLYVRDSPRKPGVGFVEIKNGKEKAG